MKQSFLQQVFKDPIPLLLVLAALVVYLPGISWGIPHPTGPDFTYGWGNDDLVPLHPLAEMHNTFIVAKPDRNLAYPWFHYFLLAVAYSPYLAYLFLTGGLAYPSPVYPFGLSDPVSVFRHLSWIGKSVSILLALTTVVGAYYTGKFLWNRTTGLLAAVFTMLIFPIAYYARLGNPDVPALGWISLALAASALSLRQGLTVKRGVWFGIFVALAIATKDQSAASFLLLAPVLFWIHLRERKKGFLWGWNSIWAAPVATTLGFGLSFAVASGLLVDPLRFWQHISQMFSLTVEKRFYLRHPPTLDGFLSQAYDQFAYVVDVMSWPLVLAAAVGIGIALVRDRRSLVLVLSSVGFFLMLLPVLLSRIHYLMPVALPLNLFAAYAFTQWAGMRRPIRLLSFPVALGVTGYLLLQTADLTHDMMFDSRYEAASWLKRHTGLGDTLLYFGPGSIVPPLRPEIGAIKVIKRAEAHGSILNHQPEFILVMPFDINENRDRVEWRYGPHSIHSGFLPSETYAALVDESLGYRLVAQFQTPRLFPWLNRPFLSYATLNPPIQVFARHDRLPGMERQEPWKSAPHYPRFSRVKEITLDSLTENAQ